MAEKKETQSHIRHILHPSQLEYIDVGQHFYLDILIFAIPLRMYSGNMWGDDHFLFDFPRGFSGQYERLENTQEIYHVFYRGPFYLQNQEKEGIIFQDIQGKIWFYEVKLEANKQYRQQQTHQSQ